MIRLSAGAQAQVEALERHYAEIDRDVAALRMSEAIERAGARIEEQIGPFLLYPRPYPAILVDNWKWLKEARYWIAFEPVFDGYMITAVFYDTANIPGRL